MKKKTEKKNRGFSLVELIVVVMILAILAVTLVPQVLKWVERSRVATDAQQYNAMKDYVKIALTDATVYSALKDETDIKVIIQSTDNVAKYSNNTICTVLENKLTELAPSWKQISPKANVTGYSIEVDMGHVHVLNGPASPDVSDVVE